MTVKADRAGARQFWGARGVGVFGREREWVPDLARRIVDMQPDRVLEFGCAVGRHLKAIRAIDPSISLAGIDINGQAVEWGRREWDLPLVEGDETTVDDLGDFDVILTVSVIDHVPDPERVLRRLMKRTKTLVLVEPWFGYEGRVTEYPEGSLGHARGKDAEAAWLWSWDIPTILDKIKPGMHQTVEPYPLRPGEAGEFYRLHVAAVDGVLVGEQGPEVFTPSPA